eukprot:scaffold905_cov28-Tisochrysis_lutea.AAC.2
MNAAAYVAATLRTSFEPAPISCELCLSRRTSQSRAVATENCMRLRCIGCMPRERQTLDVMTARTAEPHQSATIDARGRWPWWSARSQTPLPPILPTSQAGSEAAGGGGSGGAGGGGGGGGGGLRRHPRSTNRATTTHAASSSHKIFTCRSLLCLKHQAEST